MTAGIVDGLEAVQVHEEHGVARARRLVHLQGPLQLDLELAAVREAGQRVVARVVGELLRQFVRRGDVRQRALEEQDAALLVPHRARVLQHHDLAAVLALQHEFDVADLARFRHRPYPVGAVTGIHVDVAGDVELEQFVLGFVAEHAHQRGIGRHELAVGGGLEHARGDVLEQLAIALLGGLQREQRVRALGRVTQRLVHELRRKILPDQVVERATADRLVAEFFVALVHEHDDRYVGGFRLDAQEGRETRAVGQVQVEHRDLYPPGPQPCEPLREAAGRHQAIGSPAQRLQDSLEGLLVPGLGTDQQHIGRHDAGSIGTPHPWICEVATARAGASVRPVTTRAGLEGQVLGEVPGLHDQDVAVQPVEDALGRAADEQFP